MQKCEGWVGTDESSLWRKIGDYKYRRRDGAVVLWDQRSPYVNPLNENARMWTAWEPDPSQNYVSMSNGRRRWPKRWKYPDAAMREIDRLYPCGKHTPKEQANEGQV